MVMALLHKMKRPLFSAFSLPPLKFNTFYPKFRCIVANISKIACQIINSRFRDIKTSSNHDHDHTSIDDEARRLMQEIEITINEVRESRLYRNVVDQLQNNPKLQEHIGRVLGGGKYSHVQMVIYCLGSIEFSFCSQYQLALALLLKQDFSDWISGIEAFDPKFTPADCKVMEALGCTVLTHNEECRRRVEKPTLFFMPVYEYECMGNLLEANWVPSQLNKTILLTNSFKDTAIRWRNRESKSLRKGKVHYDYISERLEYIKAIQKHSTEFLFRPTYPKLFSDIGWHFFNLDPNLNLDTLLPADPSKEMRLKLRERNEKYTLDEDRFSIYANMQDSYAKTFMVPFTEKYPDVHGWSGLYGEYRGPRWVRCMSLPPYPGWMKLNFSGVGYDEDDDGNTNRHAGFGGVFSNEKGEIVATYSGKLGKKDKTFANAEALKQGLRCLKRCFMSHPVKKLIVEGNDLSIIRWVNKVSPEPPAKRIRAAFNEVFDLMGDIETVVYYIHDEANLFAIDLANKGTQLRKLQVWVLPN